MTALRKRAHAQETRFIREEELTFRAEARRNALIGLWAAVMIDTPDAEAYARGIVEAGVENPNGVIDRLHSDFEAAGVIFLEDDIRDRMTGMLRSLRDEMYAA
ncbi:hypothetical protein C8J34_101712 [Rhizobium sp. PP-F2F-G36]|nr:hypothetical protein C8J34_101712 [Rhizobium sp. PP-F2F-G36]